MLTEFDYTSLPRSRVCHESYAGGPCPTNKDWPRITWISRIQNEKIAILRVSIRLILIEHEVGELRGASGKYVYISANFAAASQTLRQSLPGCGNLLQSQREVCGDSENFAAAPQMFAEDREVNRSVIALLTRGQMLRRQLWIGRVPILAKCYLTRATCSLIRGLSIDREETERRCRD